MSPCIDIHRHISPSIPTEIVNNFMASLCCQSHSTTASNCILLFPFAGFFSTFVHCTGLSWNMVNENGTIKYACATCGKLYLSKRSLSNHKNYECGQPRKFGCDICNKRFMYKHHLQRHIARKHPFSHSSNFFEWEDTFSDLSQENWTSIGRMTYSLVIRTI